MTATGQDSPLGGPSPALRFTAENAGSSLICAGPGDTLYVAAYDLLDRATIVRISPSGDVLWRALALPGQSTFATAIVADDQGNLYVAGTTILPGTHPRLFDGLRSPTAFVIRLRPDGTIGKPTFFTRPEFNYTSITALAIERETGRILGAGLTGNIGSLGAFSAKAFLAWIDRETLQIEILAQDIGGENTICGGGGLSCVRMTRMTRINQILFHTNDHAVLVQGDTTTSDFATQGAIQEACYCLNGSTTGWAGIFDLASGARSYTTYLSGHRSYLGNVRQTFGPETISRIHWSEANPDQIVIAGITGSPGFPTTPGAYRSDFNCSEYATCRIESAFLATIDWKNSRLLSSTLYGERPAGGPPIDLIEDPAGRGYWLVSANLLALFNPSGTRLLAELKLPDQLSSGFAVPVPGGFATTGDHRVSRYDFPSTPGAGRIDSISEETKDAQSGPAALGIVPGLTYQLHGNFPTRALRAFVWGVEAEAKSISGSTDRLRVTLPPAIPDAGNMVDLTVADASTGAVHATVSVNLYPEVLRIVSCQNSEGVTVGGGDGNGPAIVTGTKITCKLGGILPGQAVAYSWSDPYKAVDNQTVEPGGEQTVKVLTPTSYPHRLVSLSFPAR